MNAKKKHMMGVVGSGLATLLVLMLTLKYRESGVLPILEILAMVAMSIGVLRKSLWCIYGLTAYFGIVKGIPMLLSGNPVTIVLVVGVLYLLWQGAQGILVIRGPLFPYPAPVLTDEDRAQMQQLGVEHNGQYFMVAAMHFDRLEDALAHARSRSPEAA